MNRLLACLIIAIGALAAAEPASIPCRIAYLAKLHYAPVIIGLADGLFAKAGIETTPVLVGPGSGILTAEALATGAADAAAMGDGPAIISSTRDPLPVLLGAYAAAERQHRLVARPGITIASPADLVGKRVAVMQGSSTYAGLMLLFKKHSIAAGSVTIVNLNPKDMAAALQSSQADVAAASDPIPDLILRKVAGSSAAGDLAGLGTDYPYCLLTSRRWAEANPDGCRRLREALTAACAVINAEPERAVHLIAAATKDSEADTRRWMDLCQWSLRSPEQTLPSLLPLAQAMADAGALAKPARLVEAGAPPASR
jgi:ABC-type nitrate/sulfonate/bicarbonate transport system substrate-binding protein